MHMNLKSTNGGLLKPATVLVSTVSLPRGLGTEVKPYETCLFAGDDSEVVATYHTMAEAIKGHAEQCRLHGVKP